MTSLLSLSIRAQMFLMALIIVLPATALIVHSGVTARQAAIDAAIHECVEIGEAIAHEQRQATEAAEQLMSTLAQLPDIRERRPAATQKFLKQILALSPLYENIGVAGPSGIIWASAIGTKPVSIADRLYFKKALASGRLSSGEYIVSRITGVPVINLCLPYRGPDGAIAGAVIMGFRLEQLGLDLLKSHSKLYGYVLLDQRGTVLYRSSGAETGISDRPDSFRRMQSAADHGTFVGAGLDGRQRFITYRKLRLKGEQAPYLYIRTGIEVAGVVAQANALIVQNLFLFALSLAFCFLAALLIGKYSIIDRFAVLQAASRRLALGERQVRISDAVRGGELGELGHSFDEMAQQIEAREGERNRAEVALRKSEARYRSLFDNSLFGIVTVGADYRFQQVNEPFCRLLGYRAEELVGIRLFTDLTHPDDLPGNLEKHERMVRREAEHYTMEKRYFNKSGEVVRVICFIEGLYNEQGVYEGNIACILDITELRASEERMRLYFERQIVGMAITSPQMKWLQTNARLQQMFGYSGEELARLSWVELTHPDDLEDNLARWRAMVAGELHEFSLEKRFRRKDGSLWFASVSLVSVRKEDGQLDYVLSLYDDITERKRAEEEIHRLQSSLEQRVQERTAQLEAAIREQESFSYSVSHDLRSPLRHINSYLAILQEEFGQALPYDARYYLDRTCAASVKMGQLIDDLLELSRVSRSKLVKEEVDLSRLATGIVTMLQETDPVREVEVVIEPDLVALGDKLLMGLVLENLLGNAWKYSSRKAQARVQLGTTDVAGEPAFFVRDNGAGFDMKYQDKLFGPFQRLHGEEYDGTGIGLATVKRIMERHGGQVWADAKLGAGATFYFRLP